MNNFCEAVIESSLTVGHAYDYWATLLFYGYDTDGSEIDIVEAQAAAIGWASRCQTEIIGS